MSTATSLPSPALTVSNGRSATLAVPSVPSPVPLSPSFQFATDKPADEALPWTQSFSMHEMALLHHWTRHASRSIAGSSSADELWQGIFPRVAFQHTFVMSALLSLSALHLAHLHERHRRYYLIEAARHNQNAITGLRHGLANLTPEISDGVFACTTLNSVYIFVAAGPLGDDAPEHGSPASVNHRTLGADWITHLRGVAVVLRPVHEHVMRGPLAPLMRYGNWDTIEPDSEAGPDDAILLDLKSAWSDETTTEVYDEALYFLRRCSIFMKDWDGQASKCTPEYGYNGPWSGPFIWLHCVPPQFLVKIDQRQPHALLIFAHFGAILHSLDEHWVMSGWGRRIVSVIYELLGSYWDAWLRWPRKVVGLEQP